MTALASDSPATALRSAVERLDADAYAAALAPGVVLRSPVTSRFAFEGPEQLHTLMTEVFAVVTDVRFTSDLGDDRRRALRVEARIGRQRFSESMLLTFNDEGLVTEVELFIRPLPGLIALASALGPRLARRRSRAAELAVKAMMSPVAWLVCRGEPTAARLTRP